MSAALAGLGESGWRENLAGEFLRAADVDELRFFRGARLLHFGQERAQGRVRRLRLVGRRRERRLAGAELAALGEPLLAAAVHDLDVVVAVDLQLPECPCREPVVVVAVQHDRRLVVDAGPAEQILELLDGNDVAHERVAQLGRPVPAHRAGHMTLIVSRRIHVDLDDTDTGVTRMLSNPVGCDEHVSHGCLPSVGEL